MYTRITTNLYRRRFSKISTLNPLGAFVLHHMHVLKLDESHQPRPPLPTCTHGQTESPLHATER
jgi:hypothetical protein